MKYLCLAYYNEKKFNELSKAEVEAIVSGCPPRDQALHDSGQLLMVASLEAPSVSIALRPQKGKTIVSDGPYMETKDQLGAFFLIEARDLNDAIRVASLHPAATLGEDIGWGIEIRPLEVYDQG